MAKTKLVDVAAAAGVSKSTVSQFLNGRYEYMSAGTRAQIERAINELAYVPNSIARSLKTDRTHIIGVVVRDIAGAYTSQAIRGMDDHCKREGYNLVIYNSDFDSDTETKAVQSLVQLRVDGLIVAPSGANQTLLADMSARGLPLVQFQIEHSESTHAMVVSDYYQGAFDATEYLVQLGHRRICFVSQEFAQVKSRHDRYLGFVDALRAHHIEHNNQPILYWDRESGLQQAPEAVLRQPNPPTAFFSQHLAITIELLEAFNRVGVEVPRDASLIGFDDLPMAQFFKVPITVVQQRPYEIGAAAAKSVIQHIRSSGTAQPRITSPCTLVIRDSCAPIT